MKTTISILHHDYPAHVRVEVERKLDGLGRFESRLTHLRANLERQNTDHRVELIATLGGGPVLVADVREGDVGKALRRAVERMKSQLQRFNDRGRILRQRVAAN